MTGNKPPTAGRLQGAAFSTSASCGRPARRNRRTQLADGRAPQRPAPAAGWGRDCGRGGAGRQRELGSVPLSGCSRCPAPARAAQALCWERRAPRSAPRGEPRSEPRTSLRRALGHRRAPFLRARGERPQGKGLPRRDSLGSPHPTVTLRS